MGQSEIELRAIAKEKACTGFLTEFRKYLRTFFREVYSNNEQIVDFIEPLTQFTKDKELKKEFSPILDRIKILEKIPKEQWKAIYSEKAIIKINTQIDNDYLSKNHVGAYESGDFRLFLSDIYLKEDKSAGYMIGLLDLSGYLKCFHVAKNVNEINGEIAKYTGNKFIITDEWKSKAREALAARNKFLGHGSDVAYESFSIKEIKDLIEKCIVIATELKTSNNVIKYNNLCTNFKSAISKADYPYIKIADFFDDNYTLTEIVDFLKNECGAICDEEGALIESEEQVKNRFKEYQQKNSTINIEEIANMFSVSVDKICEILKSISIDACNGEIIGKNEDTIISIVREILSVNDYKYGNDSSAKKLEEIKRILISDETSSEEVQTTIISKFEDISPLDELNKYKGGELSDSEIIELLTTHKVFLDISVFTDQMGRMFVDKVLLPLIEKTRKYGKEIKLYVEATGRYHLYKKVEEYKRLSKEYRELSFENEEEKKNLKNKIDKLRIFSIAYNYMEDSLHKYQRILKYEGIPSPYSSDEESLRDYATIHRMERICILTYGASDLPNIIDKEALPLCLVGRIRRDFFKKDDVAGVIAQIFQSYVPFVQLNENTIVQIAESYEEDNFSEYENDEQEVSSEKMDLSDTKSNSIENNNYTYFRKQTIKPFNNTHLKLTQSVRIGDELFTEDGQIVVIQSTLLEDGQNAEGGEGILYLTNHDGEVAKVYHTDEKNYKLTIGRKEKIENMIEHKVDIDNVCWPAHALYNKNKEFVGYTMPLAPKGTLAFSKSVMQIGKPTIQKEVLIGWDRLSLVQIAKATAYKMAELHSKGILVGDVNPGNYLANPKNPDEVYLVDCDSYQFDGYVSPVGTIDFTHPGTVDRLGVKGDLHFESFLRTEEEEDFVLAMFIFQILFLNEYPFTVKGKTPAEAMRERLFPYNIPESKQVPDGDDWMIWKNLPGNVCNAFNKVFKDWKHITSKEWVKILNSYQKLIESKGFSRELAPKKYHEFNPDDPIYVDSVCELCGTEYNMHKDTYEQIKKWKGKHLCMVCRNRRRNWRTIPETIKCDFCKKDFVSNRWDCYMKQKFGEKLRCEQCKLQKVICERCGTTVYKTQRNISELRQKNRNILCPTCIKSMRR